MKQFSYNELVTIIIVNYNGKKWLKDCLDSIYSQTYKNSEVIFIDNASVDDSVIFVQKNFPKVRIIRNKKNIGYGRANNLAVERATGEVIFFLNTDTILAEDVLEKLVACKMKRKLQIIGPMLFDFEGKEIDKGFNRSIDFTGYLGFSGKMFYIDGAALMINKKDFIKLGRFDEKYFMYSEDIDLCWRAHLLGMKIDKCYDVAVRHFEGGTGGHTNYKKRGELVVTYLRRYEVEKNNLRNILKNYSTLNLLWVLPLVLFQAAGELIVYLLSGNFKALLVVVKAYMWNIVNFPETLEKRKIVQSQRIVGDKQILSLMCFRLNKLRAFISIGIPKFKE